MWFQMFLVSQGIAALIGVIIGCINTRLFFPAVSSYFYAPISLIISIFCLCYFNHTGVGPWIWCIVSFFIGTFVALLFNILMYELLYGRKNCHAS